MTLYKITFKLLSSIVTPLKGDTIWGHVVWGIAAHEGEDAVRDFLEQAKTVPNLIVSSAFPAGFVCKPYPVPRERTGTLSTQQYAHIKQQKKQKYEPAGTYLVGDFSYKTAAENSDKPPFKTDIRMHNAIDRYSNTVIDGNLYTVTEHWAQNSLFDVYVLTDFSSERVAELFTWAFEHGYGADASVGKGQIELAGKPEPVHCKKTGTEYMALAPFILQHGTNGTAAVTSVRADLFLRTGKIGGGFAASLSPYKKPVLLYDEGAVLTVKEPISSIGTLLQNMHTDSRICQAAFAPVIPIN